MFNFKYAIIGGRWDDQGGKPSGYIAKFIEAFKAINSNGFALNGGAFKDLEVLPFEKISHSPVDAFFWFPDVPNDKEKIVEQIKRLCLPKKTLLITSKNNLEGKYSIQQLIARALKQKANLFVSFSKNNNLYAADVYDPLGNCFCKSTYVEIVAISLIRRISELLDYTRVSSSSIADFEDIQVDEKFLNLIRHYAKIFHTENKDRFLGNTSFRCENGFPSYLKGTTILVSKRNIDKQEIDSSGFVPVDLCLFNNNQIFYYGNEKPSVDSPIQVLSYNYYKNVKFMLHSHAYIQDAPFTQRVIPCGAIEEFYEIIEIFPNREQKKLEVNLRGHGSIIMGDSLDIFEKIDYRPRDIPEIRFNPVGMIL